MVRERTVAVIAVVVLAFGVVAALAVGDGDEVALEPERTTTTADETTTTTEGKATTTTGDATTTSIPTSTTAPATTATTAGATTTSRPTATTQAPTPTTARPATTATTAPPATTATTRPAPQPVPLEVFTTGRAVDGGFVVTVRASNPRRGTDGGPVDLDVRGVAGFVTLEVIRQAGPMSCDQAGAQAVCAVADSPGGGRFLDVDVLVRYLQPCSSANEFRITATIRATLFPDVTDTASIIAC